MNLHVCTNGYWFQDFSQEAKQQAIAQLMNLPVTLNFNEKVGKVTRVIPLGDGEAEVFMQVKNGALQDPDFIFAPAYTMDGGGNLRLTEISMVPPEYIEEE